MSDESDALAEWLTFFASLNDDPYWPPYMPSCSRSWIAAGADTPRDAK